MRHGGQCKINGMIDYFRNHLHFLHRWLRDYWLLMDTCRPFICAWLLDHCCRTTVASIRARVASLLNRMMCAIQVYAIERHRGLWVEYRKKTTRHIYREKVVFLFLESRTYRCTINLQPVRVISQLLDVFTRSHIRAFTDSTWGDYRSINFAFE